MIYLLTLLTLLSFGLFAQDVGQNGLDYQTNFDVKLLGYLSTVDIVPSAIGSIALSFPVGLS